MSGSMIRRALPFGVLLLGLVACVLAGAPWLRAFPASTLAVPLFGAAVLSVLVPVVVIGIGVRRLWLTALIDVLVYVFFALLVTLREPSGVSDLYTGLVHGPSQILTYALPLVSPRTLLVAPVTLCWITGAVLGECLGRAWHSVLPYATVLIGFALAYAGSVRGVTSTTDGRRTDTLLAAGLLLTLLLMRAAQAWIEQDLDSEAAQPDGVLPLRGLAIGTAVSVVVTLLATSAVQSSAFSGPPTTPARVPPLDQQAPLNPVSFVAGLRPSNPRSAGTPLFRVSVDRRTSNYVAIADVDYYDGDGWSFDRTFRPSGGVVPAESDPGLRSPAPSVTQVYTIARGALTTSPWMPFLYRPHWIGGTAVNVDTASGMIVPGAALHAGQSYTVRSAATPTPFADLGTATPIATSTPPNYSAVPAAVGASLGGVVTSFANETHTQPTDPVGYLQALVRDLQRNYSLAGPTTAAAAAPPGAARPGAASSRPPSPSSGEPSGRATPRATRSGGAGIRHRPSTPARSGPARSAPARSTPATAPPSAPSPSASISSPALTGGTGFANVLAAILGTSRSATPEQYATLVALVARQIGVPARLVSGFRIGGPEASSMPAGTYDVSTAEAWTWVEVPVQGRGWVVVDPSPSTYGTQRRLPSASARPSSSPTPTRTPNALVTQGDRGGHAVAPRSTIPQAHDTGGVPVMLLIVVGLAGVVVLLVLALVLRKRLRARRRQRTGDPRRRLVGAWQEGLDVLAEAGLPDLTTLTSAEVTALTHERFGDETASRTRLLGDRANAAIFSPTTWVAPADADAAWTTQAQLRRSVHRQLTLPARLGTGLRYRRVRDGRLPVAPTSWAALTRSRTYTGSRGRYAGRRRARH